MKNLIGKDVDINDFPNALAHIKVYPQEQMIEVVSTSSKKENGIMLDKDYSKKSNRRRKNKKSNEAFENKPHNPNIDLIWKYMSLGKIDISYACVGYTYDGRPVLDHSAFVDLLVNYGFAVNDTVQFIDEFVNCAKDNDTSPIVMTNINVARITTEIKPLVETMKK